MKQIKYLLFIIFISISFVASAASVNKGYFTDTDSAWSAVGGPSGAGSYAGFRSDVCTPSCPTDSQIPGGLSNIQSSIFKWTGDGYDYSFILNTCPSPRVIVSGQCVAPPEPCVAGESTSARVFVGWAVCDDNSMACVSGSYVAPAQFSDGTCLADFVDQVPGSCSAEPGATAAVPLPIYCDLNGTKTGAAAGNQVNPTPGTPPVSGTGTGTGTGAGTGGTGSGTGGGGTPENPCTVNCGTNPDGTPCTVNCTPTPDPGTGTGTGGTGTGGTGTSPTGSQTCGGPGQIPCNVNLTPPEGVNSGFAGDGDITHLQTAAQSVTDFLNKWGTSDEPGKAAQNEFMNIWRDSFDPIPSSGCSSHSVTFGDYVWVFDPCPTASKISEIASYALWVYLFISTILLVTSKVE